MVWFMWLAGLAFSVQALELQGDLTQGGLVQGQVEPGVDLMLGEHSVPVSDDGRFLLGFNRDAPAEMTLSIRYPDGRRRQRTLSIEQREYDIQRIDGLPDRQVTPSKAALERIERESEQMDAARA